MTENLIALVEDNEDDVFFMRRALKGAGITAPVRVLTDGQQAVDFLAGDGSPAAAEFPSIVFLDLKLGSEDGLPLFRSLAAHLAGVA